VHYCIIVSLYPQIVFRAIPTAMSMQNTDLPGQSGKKKRQSPL
jgi:hypothetical protein